MPQFAKQTSVSVERTRAEIETILTRYKSTGFAYARNDLTRMSQIEFVAHERQIRFLLPMPDPKLKEFTHDKRGYLRKDGPRQEAYDQACRQRWRALKLAITAKLEAVECGISEFEAEFLANIVDPVTKKTVGEVLRPQIAASYHGKPQALLLTHDSSEKA